MTYSRAGFSALVSSTLVCAAFLLPAAIARSADEGPTWVPPPSKKWDWIHLTSGEWLKGEIDAYRDRKFSFDSDKLDDLVIDLEDVDEIYLYRLSFIRTESGDVAQGTGVLRGDLLVFKTVEGETLRVARRDIVSIVPGGSKELDYWSGKMNLSYALTSGNTQQTDIGGMMGLYRETATLRFRNEYQGVYGSQDNEKTTNNHRMTNKLDVFLTSRFFLVVPSFEYYRDEFKNLKHRVTPGVGVGYEFLRNSYVDLEAGVGAGYQYTEFEGGATADNFATTASVTLDFDLPRGVELDNSYSLQLIVTDFDNTSQHFQSSLSLDIWGPLDLEFTFILDRIERPDADSESSGGERPDSNDIQILAGFTLEF